MSPALLPPHFVRKSADQRFGVNVEQHGMTQTRAPSVVHPFSVALPQSVFGWWSVVWTGSSGGWVDAWKTGITRFVHQSLWTAPAVTTDATGSVSVRLRLTAAGVDVTTDPVAFGPGSSEQFFFNWLHEQPLWEEVDAAAVIQANVTSGNSYVFMPFGGALIQREPVRATFGGVEGV